MRRDRATAGKGRPRSRRREHDADGAAHRSTSPRGTVSPSDGARRRAGRVPSTGRRPSGPNISRSTGCSAAATGPRDIADEPEASRCARQEPFIATIRPDRPERPAVHADLMDDDAAPVLVAAQHRQPGCFMDRGARSVGRVHRDQRAGHPPTGRVGHEASRRQPDRCTERRISDGRHDIAGRGQQPVATRGLTAGSDDERVVVRGPLELRAPGRPETIVGGEGRQQPGRGSTRQRTSPDAEIGPRPPVDTALDDRSSVQADDRVPDHVPRRGERPSAATGEVDERQLRCSSGVGPDEDRAAHRP